MLTFALQVTQGVNHNVIANFGPMPQSYGSYAAGQLFVWGGHTYQIMQVSHQFVPQSGGSLLIGTQLLVQ